MNKEPTALIIIDMQKGMADPAAGERNNPDAEENIRTLLSAWRRDGRPVVHIRHVSRTPGSPFWPGQPGAEFQSGLLPLDNEHIVEKNVPDAFVQSDLERWLRIRQISTLVMVGVSTSNSVESTVRTAGNLGFDTVVVADATFTFAKNRFKKSAPGLVALSLVMHASAQTEPERVQLPAACVEIGTLLMGA